MLPMLPLPSSANGAELCAMLCPLTFSPSMLSAPPCCQVYSLMNLAWCLHEIISDYFSVALLWFESK